MYARSIDSARSDSMYAQLLGSANSHIHRSANSGTNSSYSNINEALRSNEENSEDINRFLTDNEVRHRLLNLKDNINIREASQSYNKLKTKGKFRFEPRVILLRRKGDKNVIPKEGTPE